MALKATYSVHVSDASMAAEIEQYLEENDKSASGGFREAMIEMMERDGHFEEDES